MHRRPTRGFAARGHVGDLGRDRFNRIAVHDIGIAARGDHRLGLFAFAAGIDDRLARRFGGADRAFGPVEITGEVEPFLGPQTVHDLQPFLGPGIAIVMLIELQAILLGLIGPPGRDDVEREPTARDSVDIRRRLREQRRVVEIGAHRDHQLDRVGHRGKRSGGRPGVERRLLDPLDVVEIELGDQREIIADLFGPLRQALGIVPARLHPLIGHVAQPAAEHRHPEPIAHQRASSIRAMR